MLLASPPASARAAHFHGLQIVAAPRIAVLFGESIQMRAMVEIGIHSKRGRDSHANPMGIG